MHMRDWSSVKVSDRADNTYTLTLTELRRFVDRAVALHGESNTDEVSVRIGVDSHGGDTEKWLCTTLDGPES